MVLSKENQSLSVEEFLPTQKLHPVVDVRSPGEFEKGHIPGAINIPLFDDRERAEIGTLYKLKGKEDAVLRGIELVSPKLAGFIQSVKKDTSVSEKVFVYCFRGGMRSSSFCWLLSTAGINSIKIEGGYKRYRQGVLSEFAKSLPIAILGGYTGSGKTEIIENLEKFGIQSVNLEGIARHKGSAFGFIGEEKQPSQQQFENELFTKLSALNYQIPIILEDESFRIGNIRLPYPLWLSMRKAKVIRIQIPRHDRVQRLVHDYASVSIETLLRPLTAIRDGMGPANFKLASEHLHKKEFDKVAEIALQYYDKTYDYNLSKRDKSHIMEITSDEGDPYINAGLIASHLSDLQWNESFKPNPELYA